jgi:hypothetical protein
VSGTYHSSSTDGYYLSIAHLVDKHKYFYNKDDNRRVLLCNISHHHPSTLHIVHNILHALKSKASHVNYSIGSICTGACLAQVLS